MPSPFQTRNIAHLTANYTTVRAITASTVLTSSDTGKIIAADLDAGHVTVTLPAAEAGLRITIQVWKSGSSKNLIVLSPAATAFFKGGFAWLDQSIASGAIDMTTSSDNDSNMRVTMADPEIGTRVEFVSDGTVWYLSGTVIDATEPAWADS